jgi:predicted kinase
MSKANSSNTPNSSPRLVVLVGPPACGKSTYSKEFLSQNPDFIRVNRDDLRFMSRGTPTTSKPISKLLRDSSFEMVFSALKLGINVLLDNTHCFSTEIKPIKEAFGSIANIEYADLGKGLTLEELLARDAAREKSVGEKVLKDFFEAYKSLKIPKNSSPKVKLTFSKVASNPNLPKAVIFDIDGTLATMGKRSPYDFKRVDVDLPNLKVIQHYRLWRAQEGVKVFVVSGRDAKCRQLTESWLERHGVAYDGLFMRPEGDSRSDVLVKHEIFEQEFRDKFDIQVVFDDRDKVVAMWREIGLTCFQVAPGDF